MIHNSYIRNKGEHFEPIYVPGEVYSFYMNFDKPITDPDFNNFRLNLMSGDTVVQANIGALKKDIINGIAYNIYCEFLFPYASNGCYDLAITDVVKNIIKCRSNCIRVESQKYLDNSVLFYYRHKTNSFNFHYETVPDFYNKFRLPLNKVDFQYETEKKQYRNVSDKRLRNFYSYSDKFCKIESYYFDEEAHDAIRAAYECSYIIVDGTRYLTKDGYQVETDQLSAVSKGSVSMYEQEQVFIPVYPELNAYVLKVQYAQEDIVFTDGNNGLILV